jgi:hypothetical protein
VIEYRAIVRKKMKFESGFELDGGAHIYVRETPEGWIGSYYTSKASCYSFAIEEDAFSILRRGDIAEMFIVVMPDGEPTVDVEKENDLARRRLKAKIAAHEIQAQELKKLLDKEVGS